MLKKFIAAVLLIAATVVSGVSVMAEDAAETSKFSYMVDGNDITISLDGPLYKNDPRAADVIIAVYDNDYLVKTEMINIGANTGSILLDDFTITLDSMPTDLSVKAFLWSADGKCEPLSKASTLSCVSNNAYYIDAVVEQVQTSGSFVRIYFKDSQNGASSMRWDPEDTDITFTKDGKEIDYTDLNEYDVLSIYVNEDDVFGRNLDDLGYYKIKVSSDRVQGTVESRNDEKNFVTIDDRDYYLINTLGAWALDISKPYTLYLDVYGYVAYYEEGMADKDYGVIVAMYETEENDQPMVSLINDEGESVSYECLNSYEADMFYNCATDTYFGYEGGFTTDDIRDEIMKGQTVCTYTISDGKISFDTGCLPSGGDDLEFRAASIRLGAYQLSEDTKIIDMDRYINGLSESAIVRSLSDFADEDVYCAYLFDRNRDGICRFVVVFAGIPDGIYNVSGYVREVSQTNPDEVKFEVTGGDLEAAAYTMSAGDTNASQLVNVYAEATVKLFQNGIYKIVEIDPVDTSANYGVIVAMYKSPVNDQPIVSIINKKGLVVNYECRDASEADEFYNYAMGTTTGYSDSGFTRNDIKDRIVSGQTVCTYTLSGGKIIFDQECSPYGGDDLEFNASTSEFGEYQVNDNTKIIDMDFYMNTSLPSAHVYTLSLSNFEDGALYCVYLFGGDDTGIYQFMLAFENPRVTKPDASWAIVSEIMDTTVVEDIMYTEIRVARDGMEDISVLIEGEASELSEGTVIAYAVGKDGYVEAGNLYVLYTPESTYKAMYNDTVNGTSDIFNENAAFGSDFMTGTYRNKNILIPTYGKAASKEVFVYCGPVYRKNGNNLELFLTKTDGTSSVLETESFNVTGANSYVYDYAQRTNYRVSVGSYQQSNSIFNNHFTDFDYIYVDWDAIAADYIAPAFAIVKTVDGDVTDVIYYTGEWY